MSEKVGIYAPTASPINTDTPSTIYPNCVKAVKNHELTLAVTPVGTRRENPQTVILAASAKKT